ncbi:hypothetical protein [Gilliamella sp. BG1]|uniref:hypothetical protein n=1 Tax=Gilliamella sp. BG1 TaxID=3351508 RepID=UPI00398757E0
MQYRFRHKHWQTYVLNLLNNLIRRVFARNSFIFSKLSIKLFSKIPLALALLLLLPYSLESQSLSATTSDRIHGTAPYLTFDGGQTKATTTDTLLAIELPDGSTITPSTNTSSSTNPIRLINGSTFNDIHMVVPSGANTVNLNDLVTRGNWGDDDGDGQGTNGVTATGSISVDITDKNDRTVSRSETLNNCNAPYKIKLSSTGGSLVTQYGVPNSSTFSGSSVVYYINPNNDVSVCYARPNLNWGENQFAGPSNIWNPDKGFLVQSTNSISYGLNFPTTGADGLYFDLDIGGIDASQLTWSPVSHEGITATVNWTQNVTRVTLSGPRPDSTQIQSDNPRPLTVPSLPQTFELEGRDSSGNVVVKYGFVLKQWFVNRGNVHDTQFHHLSWCDLLGYQMPQVKELTNAKCGVNPYFPCINGIDGAIPSSYTEYYQRRIDAGFFTEWGDMLHYPDAGFSGFYYWSRDSSFFVNEAFGDVTGLSISARTYAVCSTPPILVHSP